MNELTEIHKLQAQAYVAEYQAMVTRINWFMSMQFVPWAPLVTFLALIAATYSYFAPILVAWGAAAMAQVAVLVYYFALFEVYNHVRYIETELKPRMATLLTLETDLFWGYEKFLKRHGKANDPLFSDLWPVALSGIAFALAALNRIPGSGWDYVGSLVTGFLLVLTITSALRVVKTRRAFEGAA